MSKSWVVVADSGRARIFAREHENAALIELEDRVHPEARLHPRDIDSDRSGSKSDGTGKGRHLLGEKTTPKEQEAQLFAHELGTHLDNGRKRNNFDELVLVAAPSFLGLVRGCLTKETSKKVRCEVHKDLVQWKMNDIQAYLDTKH